MARVEVSDTVTVEPISNFETNAGSFKGGKNRGSKERRAGRPPREGERYPSGKLKPVDKREGGPSPANIKRLFDAVLRGTADPLCGSALGILFVHREITAAEIAAGIAYAKLRGRHDRAIGAPRRSTRSPDYGDARYTGSVEFLSPDEVAAVKKRQADTFAKIDGAMRGAWCVEDGRGGFRWVSPESERAKCRSSGDRLVALLERVCVEDRACERFELDRLRQGLQILVPHFGISG